MKNWKRFICWALLLVLLFTHVGGSKYAKADTAEENEDAAEQINYVLVLDCTRKAAEADDEYNIRKAAAKLFVDLLPVENANISILTIGEKSPGYKDSYHLQADNGHIYTGDGVNSNTNNADFRMQCIYQIVPMGPAESREKRDEIKRKIDQAYTLSPGATFSDIHCGLYAAMDVLKASGTENSKGCVFLISDTFTMAYRGHFIKGQDGQVIDLNEEYRQAHGEDGIYHTMFDDVRECAQKYNWPVNWINLQRGTAADSIGLSARKDIESICNSTESKGSVYPKNENAYLNIADLPRELTQLFASNATRLGGNKAMDVDAEPVELKLDASGMAEISVAEQGLVSEINLVLTGDPVDYIEVIDEKDEGIKIKTKDNSNSILWYSVEVDAASNAFLYSHLKAIVPTASNLNRIRIYGDANTTVYCQIVKACDPTFVLDCSQTPGTYSKDQKLTFVGKFRYLDMDITNPSFYRNYTAELVVINRDTGAEEIIECASNESGTAYQCTFSPVYEGNYEFYLQVKSNAFDTGLCRSESASFRFANGIPETVGTMPDLDLNVGEDSERIELSKYFKDADGDALTYSFSCVSDLTLYDSVPIDSEFGYWVFPAQEKEGTLEIKVLAKDPDGSSVAQTFHVNIHNRAPEVQNTPPEKIELVLSTTNLFAALLKNDAAEASLDVSQYFTDPDGFPLTFRSKTEDISKDEDVDSVLDTKLEGGQAHVQPLAPGKAEIRFTAEDNNGATASFTVTVVVKKASEVLLARYWIVLAILAFILFVIVVMLATKKVHGHWSVEVTDLVGGMTCLQDGITMNTGSLKKKKVDLSDLVIHAVELAENDLPTQDMTIGSVVLKGTIFGGKCGVVLGSGKKEVMLGDAPCTKSKFTLKSGVKLKVTYFDPTDRATLEVVVYHN